MGAQAVSEGAGLFECVAGRVRCADRRPQRTARAARRSWANMRRSSLGGQLTPADAKVCAAVGSGGFGSARRTSTCG